MSEYMSEYMSAGDMNTGASNTTTRNVSIQ